MAKAEKAAEAAPKEKVPEFKYGVKDLVELLGIQDTSVRVGLRKHQVPKAGKSYGWNTKEELKEVAELLSTKKEKPAAAEKAAPAKATAKKPPTVKPTAKAA